MSSIDYKSFPYLVDLGEVLSSFGNIPLDELMVAGDGRLLEKAVKTLETLLESGRPPQPDSPLEIEVLGFYALASLVKALGNPRLYAKIAVGYSKWAGELLRSRASPSDIASVGSKLGLSVRVEERPAKIPVSKGKRGLGFSLLPFSMDFLRYLQVVSRRLNQERKYRPSNNIVEGGRIFLDRDSAVRVIEEAIFQRVLEIINASQPARVPEEAMKRLRELVAEHYKEAEEAWERPGAEGELPPCVAAVLEKLKAGENLSHHERFFLASFMLSVGKDVEYVVDLFRTAPDFDEKKTRYQVEHIAGMRGSGKKYLPFSCDKLKALQICPRPDYCPGGRNPLAVYRRGLRREPRYSRGKLPAEGVGGVREESHDGQGEGQVDQ